MNQEKIHGNGFKQFVFGQSEIEQAIRDLYPVRPNGFNHHLPSSPEDSDEEEGGEEPDGSGDEKPQETAIDEDQQNPHKEADIDDPKKEAINGFHQKAYNPNVEAINGFHHKADDPKNEAINGFHKKAFNPKVEASNGFHQKAEDRKEEAIHGVDKRTGDPENENYFQAVIGITFVFAVVNLLYQTTNLNGRNKEASVRVGGIYHREEYFLRNYEAMERDFKVFVYPEGNATTCYHPADHKLNSKYAASEHYFFMNLIDSRFLTNDPHEAHLFFIPISCRKMGSVAVQNHVKGLFSRHTYWKRTLGADHFFVSCHDIASRATEEVPFLLKNAIQLVCSPSYDSKYIPHKDVALPQILELSLPPLYGDDMWNLSAAGSRRTLLSPESRHPPRTKLGFWAGSVNSEVRKNLQRFYKGDPEFEFHFVSVERSAILRDYQNELYGSKFCICPRGETRVNGVCLAESMAFGCVPVILSDYYNLPFNEILDWNSFSVILKEDDVPELAMILKSIPEVKYMKMHQNLLKVRKHFKWNSPPVKYDLFHMVMYELWKRRHIIRYRSSY